MRQYRMDLQWQYNGAASWHEIAKWCEVNFGRNSGAYQASWDTIQFFDEKSYTFFMLKWA